VRALQLKTRERETRTIQKEPERLNDNVKGRCPVCGQEEWTPVREGNDLQRSDYNKIFKLTRCLSCGHIMQNPQPGADELEKAYVAGYAPYRPAWKQTGWPLWRILRELTTWRRIRRLKRYAKGTRLLEVGSGAGDFLYASRKTGWEVAAVEYSEPLVETVRSELDLDIRAGELKPGLWEAGSFDLVVLWSVLEHVPDPLETLRTVCSYLRPGGTVFLQIPTLHGIESGLSFKQYWALLDLPRHLNFFGKESLSTLCGRAGLELTLFKTPLLDIAWCYFMSNSNFANDSRNRAQKIFRLASFVLSFLFTFPSMAIQAWRARGTEAFVVAVKR
jgi:SAM-dependent methyltransferase